MSVEDPFHWAYGEDEKKSSHYPKIPSSGRLNSEDGLGASAHSAESLVESGRFNMIDVMESSIDFTVLESSEGHNDQEDEPWSLERDSNMMTLDWGETEQREWWQEEVASQDCEIDPKTGEYIGSETVPIDDISDFSPGEIAQLSCEVSFWEEITIENGEQNEAEALEVERLLDLGELENELE